MKKKLYYIVGILVFLMTIFSLLGYSNTLEANKRVSEFNKDGAYQMQNFSNQENLLIKNLSTIKNGYINHWLQHCGQTSYNGYRNRHLFCAHWYNGSGRKEEKYEILDVLDIGYYGGNGNVELKSPTYIYSYASNKEIYDTSTVSVFLAQQAYRSTVELSVEIDDVMPNVIKNLKPVLSSDVIKKLESATYSGSSSMGLDFTNTRANVWAIHNERAYPTGKYYDPTIYNVTKNIGEFSEMKTLDSQGNYTEASATINLESENRVGPFYLKIPHGAKVTVNTDIPYEIEGGAIVSEKGFYINFTDSVPDEISFSCTYEQYYGRIFIAYGGISQDVWISTGDKAPHTSTVKYTVIKGSDLSANTYIQYSRYRNETPILNSTEPSQENHLERKSYTEEQKQENPFYAEQGDILKVGIDVKNNTSSNATVGKINSNYEDILSLSTQEELEEKWKTDLTEQLNNSVWIEIDELNSYATTYYNNTEYAELSQKILSKNNTITENLMLTVNANPKEHTEQYEINGNILLEDITPEDLDESNNSSSDYMKIKSIDAEIKKEILEGSSDGARAEDGKYMVEYGDIIEYMITVSNPVPDGKDENSVSTLYNTKFVESIPEGLEIQDVKRFTSNGWESVLNDSQIQIVDNNFEVTINNNYGISPNNAAVYIFQYKVISYGIESENSDEEFEKITNTANLVEYYNRNNYQYIDTDSSSEDIYVRSYELDINKFLYTFSDVNSPISSGISACEGRELLSEEEKAYNPMYVEYGDRIAYQIDVTNEGDCAFSNIKIDDIFDNQELQLDINLDNYVLVTEVENDNIIKEISNDKSQIRYTILELKPGEKETIRIVFNVIKTLDPNDEESNNQIINTAKIISATNHNDIEIIDEENTLIGQIESSEHCIEKLYNVETNKYISSYTSEMMNENIENGLINEEEEAALYYDGNLEEFEFNRENLSNEEKAIKPFAAEKSDKVTFTIKVENKASENEESNSTITIGTILDYLDSGLELIDESFRGTLNQNNKIKTLENNVDFSAGGIDKYTDTIAITFLEKIVLKPGEYIEFNYDVEITASNMMVELLKNEVILTEIVNRNGLVIVEQMGQGTPSVDTGLNPPPTISTEYVELKDVVVSGYIWDDKNENGLKDEEEPGIPNVEVELNGLTEESKANMHTKVTTNEDGLYTFGRVFKTNQNEEYEEGLYITYQYNGAEYQNTVYSGKTNLVYENNAYRMEPDFYIDSNAKEIDIERIEFNDSLKTIYYDGASKEFEPTTEDITLKYNKEDSISTNTNNYSEENGALIKAYSFLNNQDNEEIIECLWFDDTSSNDYDTEYLKHINLGLVSRDKLDLSVTEKLDNITNTVFGESLGYKYKDGEEAEFKYYAEDYYYKYTDYKDEEIQNYLTEDSELTTTVTYKATIQNGMMDEEDNLVTINDDNVIVQVNELALYLDNKFTVEINETTGIVDSIIMKQLSSDDVLEDKAISTLSAYAINEFDEKIELEVYLNSKYNPLEAQMEIEEKTYIPLYVRPKEGNNIIIPNSSLNNTAPGNIDIYFTFVDCNRSYSGEELIKLNEKYNHTLEITSYSSYYEIDDNYFKDDPERDDKLEIAGNGAGFVDIDSNPGNIGLNNNQEYINFFDETIEDYNLYDEDDTCRGEIIFKVDEPDTGGGDGPEVPRNPEIKRTISGMVFEDIRSDAVKDKDGENIQYIGNGLYNQTDTLNENAKGNVNAKTTVDSPVKDITVKLYKMIKIGEEQYYEVDLSDENQYEASIQVNVEDMTDENGNYELSRFTPGTYFTRFEYGNNSSDSMLIYNGQDFKSTILADLEGQEDTYYNLSKILNEDNFEYGDNVSEDNSNVLWTIRVLKEWLAKYYEYNSTEAWYEAMLADYKTYTHLEQGFVNGFSMLGSHYSSKYGADYAENASYKLLMQIGNDVMTNKITYPEIDIVELLYSTMDYSDIVKIYRNSINNYIENTIGSNAIDDALRRLETIKYSQEQAGGIQEINNIKAEILAAPYKLLQIKNDENLSTNEKNKKIKAYEALTNLMLANTSMFADSVQFYVRTEDVEYDLEISNDETQYVDYEIRNEILYSLENLGFGLQYRPENQLTLREYVKELKIETSTNTKPLVHLFFDEDKKLIEDADNVGLNNVQSLDSLYELQDEGRYTYQKGFKFVNIDEQLLQGAIVYIKYGIYIDNTGEIDRVSSNLYKPEFTKSAYEENLKDAIEEYSAYYSEDYKYLTKPKDYLNYYKKYLGNTYYTGKIESDDDIEDSIVAAKVNEVVNDIDGEILFDNVTYNQEWKHIDDIQSLINDGTYLFTEDYNMSNTELSEEEDNTFTSDFIITTVLKYLNLYNNYESAYDETAFKEWYKSMINEFKTYSYLEQGIGNAFGISFRNYVIKKYKGQYQGVLLYEFIDQIGQDAFSSRKTFEDESDYEDIENIISGHQKETIEVITELLTEINTDKSSMVTKSENGNKSVMKKVKSLMIEEPLLENSYNTTYKFISPISEKDIIDSENRVTLEIVTQRELSADLLNYAELSFDNASEIINYTAINGRRTSYATTVGNGVSGETDSDESVERVTFSKPTGLSQMEQKKYTIRTLMICAVILGILVLGGSLVVYKIKKSKNKITFIK